MSAVTDAELAFLHDEGGKLARLATAGDGVSGVHPEHVVSWGLERAEIGERHSRRMGWV